MIFENVISKSFDWVRTFLGADDQVQPKNVSDTAIPVIVLNDGGGPGPSPTDSVVQERLEDPAQAGVVTPTAKPYLQDKAPSGMWRLWARTGGLVTITPPYRPFTIEPLIDFRSAFFNRATPDDEGYPSYFVRLHRAIVDMPEDTIPYGDQRVCRFLRGTGSNDFDQLATSNEFRTYNRGASTTSTTPASDVKIYINYTTEQRTAVGEWGFDWQPSYPVIFGPGKGLSGDAAWKLSFAQSYGDNRQVPAFQIRVVVDVEIMGPAYYFPLPEDRADWLTTPWKVEGFWTPETLANR